MYTWEIQQHLENNNYYIESELYLQIVKSPQINYVKYEPYSNQFHMTTSDGLDVKFTVYCEDYL